MIFEFLLYYTNRQLFAVTHDTRNSYIFKRNIEKVYLDGTICCIPSLKYPSPNSSAKIICYYRYQNFLFRINIKIRPRIRQITF